MWSFKTEKGVDSNIEKFKAKIVAKGFTQNEGIEFNKTFHRYLQRILFEFLWNLRLIMILNYIKWM